MFMVEKLKHVNFIYHLCLTHWGKGGEKGGKVNFFCKHLEFYKWIVKDKQKATLGSGH